MATLLGPGADFFVGYLRVNGLDNRLGFRIMHTAVGAIVSLIQGFVCHVFLYFARALGKELLAYVSLRRSISNQYNLVLQQIGAVVMALFMNGVFLMANVIHTFLYIILMRSRETPVAIVRGYLVLLPVLRMGLFYWQVLYDLSLLREHVLKKSFFNLITVSAFQIQLMKSRQRGSKTPEVLAVFYRFLCFQKRHSSSTVFPDVDAVNNAHQEEISDHSTSSFSCNNSTITSTSSAEVYDYSIELPSLSQNGPKLQESVRDYSPAVLRDKRAWTI
jgi:hypothetical protein